MSSEPLCQRVEKVAERWGCEPEKAYWLIANGHVRAFTLGSTRRTSWRVRREEIQAKAHLAQMAAPEHELAKFRPKPARLPSPPFQPVSELAQKIWAALRSGPSRDSFVYSVRCGEFVKVGYSSAPKLRFAALRTYTPHDLELLKFVAATASAEKAVHAVLAEYRHRFEWFHLKPELLSAILELRGSRSRY